jgi:diguanylate cyclase (GGDEF)-like protein
MNVLIIDDDKAILLFVKAFFEEAGHNTAIANCGNDALELFDKQNFDLIVTDVVMPGLDGFQTIEKIRKKSISFILVIFMTSSKEDEELQKGIDAGGGLYLPKPLKPILLESYIKVMENLVSMRDELIYKANYDSLTGLPNRNLLYDRLHLSINRAKRSKTKIILLFIDLDHFKNVNDLMGHDAGDAVLKETANRLQACIRDSDTISRIGGDEFIIMLPDIDNSNGIDKVIDKILNKLNSSFLWGNKETPFISGSIGVSIYPDDATDIDGLLKTSDTAMYKAKKDGRNNCSHYNQELGDLIHKHTLLENELRHAIERGQLELYYQPQLTCNTYRLSGMEALLRWHHPEFGAVSPVEFIPIAEDSGIISSIGIWVLKTVCEQIKVWRNLGYKPPRISINLSVRQLKDENLETNIIKMIESSNVGFDSLALEITESCIMDKPEKLIKILARLRSHGLKISMDDFGTGYSSMSYLKRLPIDQLKIDREFIRSIPDNIDDCNITRAIITLGHSLGLNVIAEGVETSEQFKFLKTESCDEIQGYFFGKPQSATEIMSMLKYSEINYTVDKPLLKTA